MTWWIVMSEPDAAFWAPALGCPGSWDLLDLAELAGVTLKAAGTVRARALESGTVEKPIKTSQAPSAVEDDEDEEEEEDDDPEVRAARSRYWTLTEAGATALRRWPEAAAEAERWAIAAASPLSGRACLTPAPRKYPEDPHARGRPVPVRWIPGKGVVRRDL